MWRGGGVLEKIPSTGEVWIFSGITHWVKFPYTNTSLYYFIVSQTVALWLRNTNYEENHRLCFLGLKVEAYAKKVKLFQRKSVFEILWGYTDPFLEFLITASKDLNCPGQEGMTSFVQLQVIV